jgi:uncharacterized protein YkwD
MIDGVMKVFVESWRRTMVLIALVLPCALSSCGSAEFSGVFRRSDEDRLLALVNRERSRRGLEKLRADKGLRSMADEHAGVLVKRVDPTRGRPSFQAAHQGFNNRAKQAREQGYLVLSEVIMIGYAGDFQAVPERTLKGWLGSSEHRSAILHEDRRLMGIASRVLPDQRYFVVGLLSNGRFR